MLVKGSPGVLIAYDYVISAFAVIQDRLLEH